MLILILHPPIKTLKHCFRTHERSEPHLKNKVRKLRIENGLPQTELGQIVNASRQTIYAIESGRFDPSIWLAYNIATLFDMKIEDVDVYKRQVMNH